MMKALFSDLINSSFQEGWDQFRDLGFVRTAPTRVGSGYTEATAYGILEGQFQMWIWRNETWMLVCSWSAVPGKLYGRPDVQVGI